MTRSKLIAPIVEKLRDQAGAGQSVALVSVQGAVKEPGEYPLIRAGGLSFLVQLAGGLEDGAYLKEVEVRRINASEDRCFGRNPECKLELRIYFCFAKPRCCAH